MPEKHINPEDGKDIVLKRMFKKEGGKNKVTAPFGDVLDYLAITYKQLDESNKLALGSLEGFFALKFQNAAEILESPMNQILLNDLRIYFYRCWIYRTAMSKSSMASDFNSDDFLLNIDKSIHEYKFTVVDVRSWKEFNKYLIQKLLQMTQESNMKELKYFLSELQKTGIFVEGDYINVSGLKERLLTIETIENSFPIKREKD